MGSIPVAAVLISPSLIAKSAALQADLAAVIEQSQDLLWRSRELRLLAYPRIRPISGGSSDDVEIISMLILGAPLCVECLAKKSGVSASRVDAILMTIAGAVALAVETGRCDGCLQTRTTVRLASN